MNWLAQYFLNPGFALPGIALISVPVIIHILSRLRYKRVRFAAMEFLLQSDELNRRRLIFEQLLLLLLRILAVLLIAFLVARLVLDPSRLLMLRGASVHHVIILDDSLSMRERMDQGQVFDAAVSTLEQLLSHSETPAGSARITILLMTDPNRPVFSDRALDRALLQEIAPRLRNLRCSFRAASVADALTSARDLLAAEGGAAPQVHVLTDLRQADWLGHPEVTAALQSLKSIHSTVSLVQISRDSSDNVALTRLTSETLAVARGVPWRLNIQVDNHGQSKVAELRGSVRIDGDPLPTSILFPDLEPGASLTVSHDITFQNDGRHQVEVRLADDLLPEDNRRFLAVDVTDKRPILIVDDDGQQEDAGYVAAALSADADLTGLAAEIRDSQVLTSADLSHYDCIYLLNIRDLPADAVQLLADYVREGGGVAWFPGEQANTDWYNQVLRAPQSKLFPVPLGAIRMADRKPSGISTGNGAGTVNAPDTQSPTFSDHPIFAVYNIPDSPFADAVQMTRWFQLSGEWEPDDTKRADGVKTLARLRAGQPIVFEHSLGRGRILTFLTGAGRRWSNWPIAPAAPGYVVMHLLIHPYLQRPLETVESRELAEPLRLQWSLNKYVEDVEVFLPEPESADDSAAETFLRMKATAAPVRTASSAKSGAPSTQNSSVSNSSLLAQSKSDADVSTANAAGRNADEQLVAVTIPQANRPGVYRIRRFDSEGTSDETWLAMNVTATESELAVADPNLIQAQSGMEHVRVVTSAAAESLGGAERGRELRWTLLAILILLLLAEQLLSLRMSYHPEGRS